MSELVKTYKDLHVYKNAMNSAMEIFEITKSFPAEEKYSMVDQIRRCSRSVCANIAEAWRKRLYKAAFISKLHDVISEASETQVWLEFSFKCKYLTKDQTEKLDKSYNHIIGQIVKMIDQSDKWIIKTN